MSPAIGRHKKLFIAHVTPATVADPGILKRGRGNGKVTLGLLRLNINVKYFFGKRGGAPPTPPPPEYAYSHDLVI